MPRRLLFDSEANGLLPEVTKAHCIAAVDLDTRQRFDWKPDEIPQALEVMSTADRLYAHNGLRYDYPVLAKVYGFNLPREKQGDTLVISRLIYPNLKDTDGDLVKDKKLPSELHGSHKIEAWGYRLEIPKLHADITDWSEWTPQMHERCISDTDVLLGIWDHLDPDAYSQDAIELEHRIAYVVDVMEREGWPFDEKGAAELHVKLLERHSQLAKELIEEFGFWYEPKEKKTRSVTKTPEGIRFSTPVVPWFTPKRDDKLRGYVTGHPCTKLEKVTFNPSSRDHIIRCLQRLGWKPKSFTDSGKPALDDEILESLSDQFPAGTKAVEYLLLDKRMGALATGDKAWLKKVGADGKMHGVVNPMGTPHSRASHFNPNMAQVPATKSMYGKECRQLFTVPSGWSMVGADQQGLQLRNLGHYLHPFDGGKFGHLVTSGDPHWNTALVLDLVEGERDPHNERHDTIREAGSKRFIYAYVFGNGDANAGSIIRDCCVILKKKGLGDDLLDKFFGQGQSNRDVGKPARQKFNERMRLGALQAKLREIRQNEHSPWFGSIPGLDGRWVPCRSDHSALNFLLSSAEAIICKRWVCDAFDTLEGRGLKHGWDGDFVFLGWIHDELQTAVRAGLEKEVGDILVECARKAGEPYGFRVPLDSKYKIGRNWAETH